MNEFFRFSPFGIPSEFSTDWLYTGASKAWAQWLPKESIHNFLHGGFYDVEIDPYFRVIVSLFVEIQLKIFKI